jgi:hypothetical protein
MRPMDATWWARRIARWSRPPRPRRPPRAPGVDPAPGSGSPHDRHRVRLLAQPRLSVRDERPPVMGLRRSPHRGSPVLGQGRARGVSRIECGPEGTPGRLEDREHLARLPADVLADVRDGPGWLPTEPPVQRQDEPDLLRDGAEGVTEPGALDGVDHREVGLTTSEAVLERRCPTA